MPSTSASLLVRLRSPTDHLAWSRFIDIYGPLLFRWVGRYRLQDHDAADVVQEVLTVVAREIAAFRYDPQRGSFRGWLKTILTYQLRAHGRRRQAHPAGVGDSAWQQRLNEWEDPRSQLSSQWDVEHHAYVARRALDQIQQDFEPATWQTFWALVMDGRKPAEIAAELGMTRNAVYIAKYRVLERLRQVTEGLLD